MRDSPLKIAVLGLDDTGRLLLEATKGLDCFSVAAVADSDINLAQQVAKSWNCAAYDDYRQLIIANQLDCLFVAAPLHSCAEYLKMALKKKFNILKLPPLARNFSEALELTKLAQNETICLAIANPGRFASSAVAMKKFILENPAEQVFFILAAADKRPTTDLPPNSPARQGEQAKWHNDPLLAGGGAILYDCWEIIDQIVWNFGIPQQVYCAASSTVPDKQQRLYVTEDTAIVTMKFSDTLSGCLLAGRAAGSPGEEPRQWLTAHSQDKLLKFNDKLFEVIGSQGQRLRRDEFDDNGLVKMKKVLENFGSNLLWPDKNTLVSTADDNLKNMAVIEAAYLSARTGMPEEPGRILKIV
jgi:predicted dehydrogenase